MAFHQLVRKKLLQTDLNTAWSFFSSPHNLKAITPPYMQMQVLTETVPNATFAGQIITYTVKPIAAIPLQWMTELTHVQHQQYFVDEQRFGPFALWHHTHFFKQVANGVEMTDVVNYKMPLGFLGEIAHALFVKKQVEGIFDYRNKQLDIIFSKAGSVSPV